MSARDYGILFGQISFYVIIAAVIIYFVTRSSRRKKQIGAISAYPAQPANSISCSYYCPTEEGHLIMHGSLALEYSGMTFKGPDHADILHIPYLRIRKALPTTDAAGLPPEIQAADVYSSFIRSRLVVRFDYETEDGTEMSYFSGVPADMQGFLTAMSGRIALAYQAKRDSEEENKGVVLHHGEQSIADVNPIDNPGSQTDSESES